MVLVASKKGGRSEELGRPNNLYWASQLSGLAWFYQRFVKNFSQITSPPHDLVTEANKKKKKSSAPFKWAAMHQTAFEDVKTALTTPPVLGMAEFKPVLASWPERPQPGRDQKRRSHFK